MNIEIVKDIQNFYKTIGALDELSERQLIENTELNTKEHSDYLDELCEKYNIEYDCCGDLTEDILCMECKIDERFTNIMEGL